MPVLPLVEQEGVKSANNHLHLRVITATNLSELLLLGNSIHQTSVGKLDILKARRDGQTTQAKMSVKKNAHLQKIGHTHRYHIQMRQMESEKRQAVIKLRALKSHFKQQKARCQMLEEALKHTTIDAHKAEEVCTRGAQRPEELYKQTVVSSLPVHPQVPQYQAEVAQLKEERLALAEQIQQRSSEVAQLKEQHAADLAQLRKDHCAEVTRMTKEQQELLKQPKGQQDIEAAKTRQNLQDAEVAEMIVQSDAEVTTTKVQQGRNPAKGVTPMLVEGKGSFDGTPQAEKMSSASKSAGGRPDSLQVVQEQEPQPPTPKDLLTPFTAEVVQEQEPQPPTPKDLLTPFTAEVVRLTEEHIYQLNTAKLVQCSEYPEEELEDAREACCMEPKDEDNGLGKRRRLLVRPHPVFMPGEGRMGRSGLVQRRSWEGATAMETTPKPRAVRKRRGEEQQLLANSCEKPTRAKMQRQVSPASSLMKQVEAESKGAQEEKEEDKIDTSGEMPTAEVGTLVGNCEETGSELKDASTIDSRHVTAVIPDADSAEQK
eukprot:1338614-Pyramimonas_sp.AAC.1